MDFPQISHLTNSTPLFRLSEYSYTPRDIVYPLSFILCLLSGFDTSNNQYTLECSVRLHFDMNDTRQCYKYDVSDDDICEIPITEIFQVHLTLITNSSQFLQIHSKYSLTSAWIDDTEEPECCKFMSWLAGR